MKKVIDEGSTIPHYPWYLPAYDEFRSSCTRVVCYPIGIHLIVMYFRRLIHWMHWHCRGLTKYDQLDYADAVIENLKRDNKRLRDECKTLFITSRQLTDLQHDNQLIISHIEAPQLITLKNSGLLKGNYTI